MIKRLGYFVFFIIINLLISPYNVYSFNDWRSEFDYLCGRTDEAMTMESKELIDMIERCQMLIPVIEALEIPQKKIFFRRLESCMNLYHFVLESKDQR